MFSEKILSVKIMKRYASMNGSDENFMEKFCERKIKALLWNGGMKMSRDKGATKLVPIHAGSFSEDGW